MGGKKARKRGAGRNSKTHVDKEDLLRYVRKSADRGTNLRHILEDFNVAPAARKQIRDILNQLVKEGKLAKHRGSRYEAAVRNLSKERFSSIAMDMDLSFRRRKFKASRATF